MAIYTTSVAQDFTALTDDLDLDGSGTIAFMKTDGIGLYNPDGTAEILSGNFKISAQGKLTGGTLTGYEFGERGLLNDTPYQTFEKLFGANVDLFTLVKIYDNGGTDADAGNYIFRENDNITGSSFNDTLLGFDGNDIIDGVEGNDFVQGNRGNDVVYGGLGNDEVYGGRDNDQLFGGDGNDSMNGNIGNDIVYGGEGDDFMFGGQNDDHIRGDAGSDTISGDRGFDTLTGGKGTDFFVFNPGGNNDHIVDFAQGVDKLMVSSAFGMTADAIVAAATIYQNAHTVIYFTPDTAVMLDNFIGIAASDIMIV